MSEAFEDHFDSSIALKDNKWTQDALLEIPTSKGVLFFVDSENKPIQILQAGNLRRLSRARLIRDDSSSRKTDVSSLTRRIYWHCCHNEFLTQLMYTQLAHLIFQTNDADWIQLPKVSLAAIDTSTFLPFFYVADKPSGKCALKQFGLFTSRKAVSQFCEILNKTFGLCRNPALLRTGRETSCSYLQMNTCPGPCLNNTFADSYAEAVSLAIQTAGGNMEPVRHNFELQMRQASEQMDFETAQYYKRNLDAVDKLSHPDFEFVHPLNDLCFVHIDLGAKIKIEGQKKKQQRMMWFKITSKCVWHLGDFVPETEGSIAELLECNWTKDENKLSLKNSTELLPLISLQLFRSKRSGVWIDCSTGIWLDKIAAAIHQFRKSERPDDLQET